MTDESGTGDPHQPRLTWREMIDYVPGKLVLARTAVRQVFGFQEDGVWYEMVDGEEYPLDGFVPVEWCDAPDGPEAWG